MVRPEVCKLGALVLQLAGSEADTLRLWAEQGVDRHGRIVSADSMSKALATIGHPVGTTTLKAHRREVCVCFHNEGTPE